MATRNCHKCHTDWDAGDKRQPGFKETCVKCGAYLHCCKNCRHHRPTAHNQCYIPNTEWVGDREGANFCEEFEFAMTDAGGARDTSATDAARTTLGALFGDDTPSAEKKSKPSGFDDLFRK